MIFGCQFFSSNITPAIFAQFDHHISKKQLREIGGGVIGGNFTNVKNVPTRPPNFTTSPKSTKLIFSIFF